jgi:hypothetical protein
VGAARLERPDDFQTRRARSSVVGYGLLFGLEEMARIPADLRDNFGDLIRPRPQEFKTGQCRWLTQLA